MDKLSIMCGATYYTACIYKGSKVVNARTFTNLPALYKWATIQSDESLSVEVYQSWIS